MLRYLNGPTFIEIPFKETGNSKQGEQVVLFELLELVRTVSRLMNPSPHHHLHLLHSLSDLFRNPNSNLSATFSETQNSEQFGGLHPTTTSTCYTLSLGPFQKPKTQTSLQPFQKPRTQNVWWPLWNFGSKVAFDRNKKSTSGLC